jgi:hypothetical protein
MSTETEAGTSTIGTSTTGECGGCEVGDLACTTEMYKRQAEVATESSQQLDEYQKKFETARATYTKARADAKADVDPAVKDSAAYKLDKIGGNLKCVLGTEERKCLRDSLDTVAKAIKECSGTTNGCCVGDCSYPSEPTDGETTSSLAGLIDQYRQAAAANQACFNSLIDLLTTIPVGITNLKSAVAQLDADVKANGDKDLVRLYARYLVLKSQLDGDGLFGGFASVNAYVDCLCKAMKCSYAAWQAVIELEGRKARLGCEDKVRKAECERKQKDILEDILCEYEKCKPSKPTDPDPHGSDCGCDHQHNHGSESLL